MIIYTKKKLYQHITIEVNIILFFLHETYRSYIKPFIYQLYFGWSLNPLYAWLFLATNYLINRTSTPILNGRTPYKMLHGQSPFYDHLKVFDCLCSAQNLGKYVIILLVEVANVSLSDILMVKRVGNFIWHWESKILCPVTLNFSRRNFLLVIKVKKWITHLWIRQWCFLCWLVILIARDS